MGLSGPLFFVLFACLLLLIMYHSAWCLRPAFCQTYPGQLSRVDGPARADHPHISHIVERRVSEDRGCTTFCVNHHVDTVDTHVSFDSRV